MKPTSLVSWLFALTFASAPSLLPAQSPADTAFAPFRQGQRAAQFGASPSFVSLGFLHFTSTKSAWLLDLRFNLTEADEESSLTVDTVTRTSKERISNGSFNARVGRRFYPGLGDRAAGFFSLGVSGGYGRNTRDDNFSGRVRVSTWTAGVFGDLGADYFLTRKLSVGASFGLQAQYLRGDTDVKSSGATQRSDQNQYDVRLSPASLMLSLYF